ncbi:hypothetical protein KO317_01790 [Candidatus Micrarchaeota archaeon]|jgi:hypothetical protein|nr:hypothetical protein [Candidatus Micrarchaeota archaeon]
MDYVKILASAIFVMFVSLIIYTAGSFVDMEYYTNSDNFGLWSKIMMPNMGPPGVEFYFVSLVFKFIIGLIFTLFYMVIAKSIRQESILKTGIFYGCLLFVILGIPTTLNTFLLFAVPLGLLISWTIQGLLVLVISGMGVVYIMRYTCKFNNAGSLR